MLCASLDGRGVWGRMDACVCMAEPLCCSLETTKTLLLAISQYKIIFGVKKLSVETAKKKQIVAICNNLDDSSENHDE